MPDPKQPRILLVEDHEGKRYTIARLLRAEGFHIDEAETGTSALALVRAHHDVVVLDLKLPDILGWEVCRRIKADPATSNVMVLEMSAAYVSTTDRVRGLELGADAYLVHPVETIELVAVLRALVRLRFAERERELQRELLLATVGHDLRNPLGVITMTSQALMLSPTLTEREQPMVERIERTAQRMTRMVEQLLVFSQGLSSTLPIAISRIDLGELCRGVVRERQAQEPREIHVIDELGCAFGADPDRLTQLIDNLIGNALQYGTGPVTIKLSQIADRARLTIHNAGTPIPEAALPTLFDPFRRGTRVGHGLGLGLFIVHQIAVAHGGIVTVSSTIAEGTRITVELPLTSA
ncbi:MAG: HAMP domain-containing histidine kinase [Deltaproteobacteria bacterium]|nr:HAMP domain-containing histidine kinase [Deltaproteobacteria bacterium]